jgi:adhesin/invasin
MRLSQRRIFPLLGVVLAAACSEDAVPTPSAIVPVSDVSLSGTVDETLGPLTVKVTDGSGAPVAGVVVTFAAPDGGGTVTPALDTTDFSGQASTRWRLGEKVVAQRATASASGVTGSVSFVATTRAAAPASIAISAGEGQSAAAGSAVATRPAVVIKDRFQNPVANATVVFSTLAGGGSVTGSGAATDASGIATVGSWVLGTTAGANRLSAVALASGVTGNPITFNATGTAGAVAGLTAVGSTTLTGTVGALVTPVPSVRVADANGNPIAGAAVTFTASAGSTVVGSAKTTNASGIAAPDGWQLGGVAQSYVLTATVTGATPVTFTATAAPGAPAIAISLAGNNQTATVGRTLPIDPAVKVTDALNNPIAGVAVVFEVISGGGAAVARNTTTNASGVATVGAWTLGETPGINTLRATVTGANIAGNPITFTATATAGAPASMALQAGNNQSGTAGSALPIQPSVIVRDSRGNVVAGATVTFTTSAGSGSVATPSAVTNAAGIAAAGVWTLGTAAGAQTLTASIAGLPDVVFSATARSGAAASVVVVGDSILPSFPVASFVSPLPTIRVVDINGNPVSGAVVTFDPVSGVGNTITGETKTTGADGLAQLGTWRIGTVVGDYRMRATVAGLTLTTEPTWRVTGTALAAAQVVVAATSVQSQAAVAGAAVTIIPVVKVTDQYGNAVAGATVTFAAGGVGPSAIGNTTATTDLLGFASVGSWTMGAGSGARTLTATVSGVGITGNPITFTATVP